MLVLDLFIAKQNWTFLLDIVLGCGVFAKTRCLIELRFVSDLLSYIVAKSVP